MVIARAAFVTGWIFLKPGVNLRVDGGEMDSGAGECG
jgi:hypothetical protein